MLEAILLLLGVCSFALVLIAFWGIDAFGNAWRRPPLGRAHARRPMPRSNDR
jgi:hypothetical protein